MNKNAKGTRTKQRKAPAWDVCGFTRAINWEALDNLPEDKKKAIYEVLKKVK